MLPFTNEPLTDFSLSENTARMKEALANVAAQLGQTYPLVIGDRVCDVDRYSESLNPCRHSQLVGRIAQGGPREAEEALAEAWQAFEKWKAVPTSVRADYIFKLAALLRRRKFELAAWMVFEVGKNWAEADADVAEAIDFCEFYAREALRWTEGGKTNSRPLEHTQLRYIPLGAGIIISPWNFPLAILMGMTTAAIAAGNTVVIKPANASAVIAARAFELMQEADIPAGVVNFLPGSGLTMGEYLVAHSRTRFINFTGSKAVGLRINESAAKVQAGQLWIKRVVAEMGGKDCIIVDETADLAAAAQGIVRSAFGFQGQKCSACSRAIVVEKVYDELLDRVCRLTSELTVGPAVDNHTVNAVIDSKAFTSISSYLDTGRAEGRLATGGRVDDREGYYVHPTIFADIGPGARLAQEETFGPVLAVIPVSDFDAALAAGNNSEYGLTGSVYSTSRPRLERAKAELHVGNLYLNRGCTGALVGMHPFGGFNMSGTDSKAGGPDYLPLFLQGQCVSEQF